jgi:nucleoside-diphosphate-sugar epimerase
MKNIAIIGANSFLSQSLLKKFPDNYNIIQVYNNNDNRIDKSYNYLTINAFLEEIIDIDIIYYIASYINFSEKNIDIEKSFFSNVLLLKKISDLYPKAKIIHTSSVSVYATTDQPISELSKLNPENSYGLSKLWAELIVNNHSGGGVNVRISSLFGENMNCNTFLPLIMKDAIMYNKIFLLGDGSRLQNYIYVEDVARILYCALNYNEDMPLLAVNNKSYSNLEVANIIKSIEPNLEINFKGSDDSYSSKYDNNNTMRYLNLTFRNSFHKQIIKTFEWMKKQY